MGFSLVKLFAFAMLLAGTAITSPALAQTQTAQIPTLQYPDLDLPPPRDAITIDDGEVQLMPVPNAARYDICVKDAGGGGQCYFRASFTPSQGVKGQDGSLRFFARIPVEKQTTTGEWSAAACLNGNDNSCSNFAPGKRFIVLTRQATATEPAGSAAISNTRTVRFRWTNNPLANDGTQLIILRGDYPPDTNGFVGGNPTVAPPPGISLAVPRGANSYDVTLPPGLTTIRWAVGTCHNFTNANKGRRCSARYTTWRTATVPGFFGFVIMPTFQHARCVNCHAVAAENFQNDPDSNPNGGLPANHPVVTATTNNQSTQNGLGCRSCHTDALLPDQGNVNPGWHAAPAGLDFRNRTLMEHCLAAHFGAGNATSPAAVLSHLTEDKLILWAIGDGRVPVSGGGTRPLAPPGNINTWRKQITVWVNAGMPCN